MRFFISFLTLILVAVASADNGFVLRTVNNYKDYEFGRQYAAIVVQMSVLTPDNFVTGIQTSNTGSLTNDDVKVLHIVHQTAKFLPGKVLDFFKNVNHYHVIDSGLESLTGVVLDKRIRYVHFDDNRITVVPKEFFATAVDLELISMERNLISSLDVDLFRGMPNLKWVSFAGNRIRQLPGTLFSANLNLECMSFENNGLTNVGGDLVKDLAKLKGVSFDGNVCINIAYWNEPNMRTELTTEFTTFCGGKCDNMMKSLLEIDSIDDQIYQIEEQKPSCSWMKIFYAKHYDNETHKSSESSESNESEKDEKKFKFGPNHACPYAHYPIKAQ